MFILIACPFQHLVEQWDKEASQFGFQPIFAYQSQRTWVDRLNEALIDFNFGSLKVICTITTHDTFISDAMQRMLTRLQGDAVLVADEAHHLGATKADRTYLIFLITGLDCQQHRIVGLTRKERQH